LKVQEVFANAMLDQISPPQPGASDEVTLTAALPPEAAACRAVGEAIEEAMHAIAGGDHRSQLYRDKFRTLRFNLGKNPALSQRLLAGVGVPQGAVDGEPLKAEQLVQMTPEELASKEKQRELAEARERKFQERRVDWDQKNEALLNAQAGIKADAGLFKCRRCGKRKTSNYQKQTRCADEPMTVFVTCLNCGNKWRC
jgi:transcription elongation factor S-II